MWALGVLGACGAERPMFAGTDAAAPRDAVEDAADNAVRPPTPDVAPVDRAPSDALAADDVVVYAHTAGTLYQLDPRSFRVTRIGDFDFPPGSAEAMTDLAVTAEGDLWGVTFTSLYRIDRETARVTMVAPLGAGLAGYNALTFIPRGILGSREVLVAATSAGEYFQLDQSTGAPSRLGSYGALLGSSGDLVSVAGDGPTAGTFATVTSGGREQLARIDPRSGRATVIGPTGTSGTYGLGYWRARLYGFNTAGQVVTIDLATGAATPVATERGAVWYGAGVTTLAPTAPP